MGKKEAREDTCEPSSVAQGGEALERPAKSESLEFRVTAQVKEAACMAIEGAGRGLLWASHNSMGR